MRKSNKPDAVNPAMALWLTIEDQWHRVTDPPGHPPHEPIELYGVEERFEVAVQGPGAGGCCYQWTRKAKAKTVSVALSQEQYLAMKQAIDNWHQAQQILHKMQSSAVKLSSIFDRILRAVNA